MTEATPRRSFLAGTRGPAGRSSPARDHQHWGESVHPYTYRDAETLMDHFWLEVETILKREGIE
jgi:hypothetical protein